MNRTSILAVAMMLAGCGTSASPEPESIVVHDGDGQYAHTGSAVPVSPSVRLIDARGNGVPGIAVAFAVTGGNGSVSGSSRTTDSSGVATLTGWTLGEMPGENTITASVQDSSLPPVTFTAMAVGFLDLHFVETVYQSVMPGGSEGGGDSPQGLALADFDGDGVLDLATAACITHDVTVLFGNPDGTFQPVTPLSYTPVGLCPRWIVSADFDGDGHADVAVVNRDSDSLSILLGNGDGTFGTVDEYETGFSPAGLAVGDFNGNGIRDLVTANSDGNGISVLLGQGDGTMSPRIDIPLDGRPVQVLVADFDNDGNDDIAVTVHMRNSGPPVIAVLLGAGDGTFGNPMNHPADPRATDQIGGGREGFTIAGGDLDNDGIPDLAVTNIGASSVSVFIGRGDGTFHPRSDLWTVPRPLQIAVADFDADGNLDLLITSESSPCVLCGGPLILYRGGGDGMFQGPFDVGEERHCWSSGIAAADLNADGRPDFAVPDGGNDTVCVYLQEPRL